MEERRLPAPKVLMTSDRVMPLPRSVMVRVLLISSVDMRMRSLCWKDGLSLMDDGLPFRIISYLCLVIVGCIHEWI